MTAGTETCDRTFVAALRVSTGVLLAPDEMIRVLGFRTVCGVVNVVFRTRYVDEKLESRIPRGIWAEVSGTAPDIEQAIASFGSAAQHLASYLSFSTNAAVQDLELELCYEDTADSSERDFFQQFLPEEGGLPRPARRLNKKATTALMEAVVKSPHGERLHRAMSHYRSALCNWRPGYETMALSHLYMGMEVLAPVALDKYLSERGVSELQLASEWGVVSSDCDALEGNQRIALQGQARRRLLFASDDECYSDAKKARTGFQHGFMGFEEVRERSVRAKSPVAEYLRLAVLRLAALDEENQKVLSTGLFAIPFESNRLTRYMKGKLLGEGTELAAPNQEYPFLTWSSRLKKFKRVKDTYEMSFEDNLKVHVGEGILFKASRHEVWGPRME